MEDIHCTSGLKLQRTARENFQKRGREEARRVEMDGEDSDAEKIPHVEVMKEIQRLVTELMSDPFLDDLPPRASVEDVASVLAVEQGRAITVHLKKFDSQIIRKEYLHIALCDEL